MNALKWSVFLGILALVPGCGGTSDGAAAAGGAGGAAGSAHGGSTATGGASAQGGSISTGGTSAQGGSTSAGGTSAQGGSTFMSSLPPAAVLGTLSPSDHAKLCAEYNAATQQVLKGVCLAAALFKLAVADPKTDDEARAGCTMTYDACLQQAMPCNFDSKCTGTVAELNTCTNDTIDKLSASTAGLPACDGLTLAQLHGANMSANFDEPASCKTLDQKCPDPTEGGQ